MDSQPTTERDIRRMFLEVNPVDRREGTAMCGDFNGGLRGSFLSAAECNTFFQNGKIVAITGVGVQDEYAIPWLVGTMLVSVYPKEFYAMCKNAWVRYEAFNLPLQNLVWDQHKESIRLVEHLGCEFARDRPMVVGGLTFIPFRKDSHVS